MLGFLVGLLGGIVVFICGYLLTKAVVEIVCLLWNFIKEVLH